MKVKLDNFETAEKIYLSMINRFSNNKNILITPPTLVNGKLISEFQKKANPLNSYFIEKKPLNLWNCV